jgi:hypothetical protein
MTKGKVPEQALLNSMNGSSGRHRRELWLLIPVKL